MAAEGTKSWTIDLRMEPQRYEKIKAAAGRVGEKPHEFVRRAAAQRAESVVAGRAVPLMVESAGTKDWVIHLRVEPRSYREIQRAADMVGEKPHEFIRRAATDRANRTPNRGDTGSPGPSREDRPDAAKRERWIGAAVMVASVAAGVVAGILDHRTPRAGSRR